MPVQQIESLRVYGVATGLTLTGNDTVADFENRLDPIDLYGLSAPHGFDQLAIPQLGANVVITVAGVVGSSITIQNVLVAQIDRNDFVF
jgi:hypothetical protein